jgi:CheY-like chemotaxis protein
MNENQTILLVDDSDDDLSLLKHACRAAHFQASLQTVSNGEEAMAYLEGKGAFADREKYPLPLVMILDLNMPKMGGLSLLEWVRSQPKFRRLMIITLTASTRPEDVERAFDLGTNSYLVKPTTLAGLVAMICSLRDWLDYNHFPPPR